MQFRQLETFISIVDAGTLTGAARRLYKTQGAVSQDLKLLENGLGVQLLDRTGQRVKLTAAGSALLPIARRIMSDIADATFEMECIRTGESPVIRLTCLPSLGPRLCRLMAGYTREHPGTRWSLFTSLRGAMIAGLREDQFDLAICEGYADDGIVNIPLMRESLHLVLPHDHPLIEQAPLRPADLRDVPYIGLHRRLGALLEAQRFFSAGEAYPTPVAEVDTTQLVAELVTGLRGFGFIPDSALPRDGSTLATVPTDPPLTRQISIARSATRSIPPAVEMFTDYLIAAWPADSP
ncbi:transcriptional regulator, LysR family [Rhodococcus wratislaviensis]|uniref:Transcriptional regulator, LysR family n=1 Tax=Rhodococcus wratislaviensis TaxID=44752 RepID=A0A402C5Y2_RHOWR|nr:LysR family transcriptional regulator [Rhodococcus wratislaviensis]GCE39034.1 transcriptional regulator, LysR family [Rhodococcus wratislaviensis]